MPFETRRRAATSASRRSGARALALATVAGLAALALPASQALAAQPAIGLGTAGSFAVLGGSTVTNTGPSIINGNLGLSPGLSVTGFPPGTVNGTIHVANAVAAQAKSDLTTAYNDASGRSPATPIAVELGGTTRPAGLYSSATLGLTGTLTLDAAGDPNAVFIFQAASTLITGSASRVVLINGAQPCNVFWRVGSSATLGTNTAFAGNILAAESITLNTGATLAGRALAMTAATTLDSNVITVAQCAPPVAPPVVTPPGTTPAGTTPAGTTPAGTTPAGTTPAGTTPAGTTPAGTTPAGVTPAGVTPAGATPADTTPAGAAGTARLTPMSRRVASSISRSGGSRCVQGRFRVRVTGRSIRRVVFSLGGRVVASQSQAPFTAQVRPRPGLRVVTARVTFTDATPMTTRSLRFKSCANAVARVPRGRFGLTG